ncbi:MAG: hypothetical protein WD749_11320 [Phycisphaerales bacterium]
MRTLVFEPDHTGHHFPYVSHMLPAVAALGETVLVTGRGAPESEPYRAVVRPLEGTVRVDATAEPPFGTPWESARQRAAALLAAVERHRPDHVIVMYADGVGQALALRRLRGRRVFPRAVEAEALFLRGGFAYPGGSVRRRAFARAAWALAERAPFTRFHHLDPLVFERLDPSKWNLMPDPVESPPPEPAPAARRRLGIPVEGRYIGCAGMMDARKGVDLLLAAFAGAGLRADDRLLLAGPHDAPIRALLAGPYAPLVRAGRVVSLDKFVSGDVFTGAIAAMDVVCTPYPAHIGSASIVIRAAAAERPVLGASRGWIGWAVRTMGLGWTTGVGDAAGLAGSIRTALEGAAGWRRPEIGARFVLFHSPENFARAWCVGLRRRLGLPPEAGLIAWEWVVAGARETASAGGPAGT